MIKFLLIAFTIFSISNVYSQSLSKSINENELISYWKSDSLFDQKEYAQAIEFYKQCAPKNDFSATWSIKKSLCYLLKDTIAAQAYFKEYVNKGGYYISTSQISQIPYIDIIATEKEVQKQFWQNTYVFENSDSTCLYPLVLKILMKMRNLDQEYRHGQADPNITLTTIDSLNRVKLDSLISIYGWLGYKEVGKSGENASFLIVQHSDRNLKFQEKCIKLMYEELLIGNIYPPNFAMLYDRIKVNSNKAQLFGSQVERDPKTNKFRPKKIHSYKLLNAYRLYFGFSSIEDYLELMSKRNN